MEDIQQIMTRPVITCRPDDTLNTAAQLMWERDCGAIPITDDAGALVGIITDRDVCMAAYTKGVPLYAIPISEAMATPVYTSRKEESLEAATKLMAEKQIHRLPIVDGANTPVGILTLNDIARHAAAARAKSSLAQGISQTLAAIAEPRAQASQSLQVQPPAQLVAQQRATAATRHAERP